MPPLRNILRRPVFDLSSSDDEEIPRISWEDYFMKARLV